MLTDFSKYLLGEFHNQYVNYPSGIIKKIDNKIYFIPCDMRYKWHNVVTVEKYFYIPKDIKIELPKYNYFENDKIYKELLNGRIFLVDTNKGYVDFCEETGHEDYGFCYVYQIELLEDDDKEGLD